MAIIASHLSTGKVSIVATCWMPALFTSTSIAPNCSVAKANMASISADFDISAPWCTAFTPCCSICAMAPWMTAESPKPFKTRFAPACASAVATPRPIPLVDPVTSAVLPASGVAGDEVMWEVLWGGKGGESGCRKVCQMRITEGDMHRRLLTEAADARAEAKKPKALNQPGCVVHRDHEKHGQR